MIFFVGNELKVIVGSFVFEVKMILKFMKLSSGVVNIEGFLILMSMYAIVELKQFLKIWQKLKFFSGVHWELFEACEKIGPEPIAKNILVYVGFLELVLKRIQLTDPLDTRFIDFVCW